MKPRDKDDKQNPDPMKRMDEALKAAMKMPPRKHKDEPKRPREGKKLDQR